MTRIRTHNNRRRTKEWKAGAISWGRLIDQIARHSYIEVVQTEGKYNVYPPGYFYQEDQP